MIPGAFQAAVISLELWVSQCEMEKDTASFTDNLKNGQARIVELTAKLVAFALRAKA